MRTKTNLAVRLVTRVTQVTRVDSPKTLIYIVVYMKSLGYKANLSQEIPEM